MATITSKQGGRATSGNLDELIATFLSRIGGGQAQTKRALERAALPSANLAAARADERAFAKRREGLRPHKVEYAGLEDLVNKYGVLTKQLAYQSKSASSKARRAKTQFQGIPGSSKQMWRGGQFSPLTLEEAQAGINPMTRSPKNAGLSGLTGEQLIRNYIESRGKAERYGLASARQGIATAQASAKQGSLATLINAMQDQYLLPGDVSAIQKKLGL